MYICIYVYVCMYIYIYIIILIIFILTSRLEGITGGGRATPRLSLHNFGRGDDNNNDNDISNRPVGEQGKSGRGDDTVGNPHRARISRFELFEPILLSKLDKRFPD